MKRFIDLCISCFALIILFPVFIFLYLATFFAMGRPVIFKQLRPGFRGEPFYIYKFRTMKELSACSDDILPQNDDQRLTKFGRMIRKASLDELPQLLNVIKGDLSLVGPRPLLMEYLPLYNEFQKKRHNVKPGITGWAQINGRNNLSWEQKFELDVWYVENQSHWLDFKILLLTILKVLSSEGISSKEHETSIKFQGNANE